MRKSVKPDEKIIRINGKKIELVKWVAMAWFTLTVLLLGFAVAWGINLKTVLDLSKITQQHDVILRGDGTTTNPGLVNNMSVIKNDLGWIVTTLIDVNSKLDKIGEQKDEKNK